jgi:peptide/nickel transport system ATP-binding protein
VSAGDDRRLLDVRGLTVRFPTADGIVQAVSDVSFSLNRGETLGIVGESGSGKSVSNLAIMGLLNSKRTDITGEVDFLGRDLLTLPASEMQKIRGKDIAMVFQDPFACLHPMYRVGTQIQEAVLAHLDVGKDVAWARAVELLGRVGIPNSKERARDYPHQYSGGMRQRAMIAMALVHNPAILICDEPTTALDVTVQAQIIELIEDVKSEFDIGVILVTHDLGVVAEIVRDQDHADVEVALHLVDQLEDLRLHRHVERGRRLVGDQHVGVVHERHRDHRALAHSA